MATINVDSDEVSCMSAEIMRGVPKDESKYATTSEDHSFMWDVLTDEIADIPMPEPTNEIQPPLMNEEWDDPAAYDQATVDDQAEGV